jgi:hypothetical protein
MTSAWPSGLISRQVGAVVADNPLIIEYVGGTRHAQDRR